MKTGVFCAGKSPWPATPQRGLSRRQTPHPNGHSDATGPWQPAQRRGQQPPRGDRAHGHHGAGQLFGTQGQGAVGPPVPHHGPEARMRQQPLITALTAARETEGRQQDKRRGRQQGQDDAHHAQDQAEEATQRPDPALPAWARCDQRDRVHGLTVLPLHRRVQYEPDELQGQYGLNGVGYRRQNHGFVWRARRRWQRRRLRCQEALKLIDQQ